MREPDEVQGFSNIVGRDDIIKHLQNAISQDKVSHAYIFGGEQGSGKMLVASLFARTLLCEEHGAEPCNHCSACRRAMTGNHPDIVFVTHEKPNSIGIDEIREQVVNDISIKPYDGGRKVYIIEDASKMTPQAQNALLKTIEEPPAYAVIILLADNPEILLQTIRSRSVLLQFKSIDERVIKSFLMQQMHVPDYQAEIEAAFAQGNIGRAKKIAESSGFIEMTQTAITLLKRTKSMDVREMIDYIKALSADKLNIYDYLELSMLWFRDVLLFKATQEVDGLIFKEEINAIQDRAQVSSYEGIQAILEAIKTAEGRLRANVNFDLTLELLFLSMREN